MANLLGLIVAAATFPGIILHNWSRKIFSGEADMPINEVPYKDLFLVTVAPFVVNSCLALLMFVFASLVSLRFNHVINIFFVWLGFSFAAHAFPNNADAKHIWERSKRVWRQNPIAMIGFPFVIIVFIANLLSIFWFDFIYAILLYSMTDSIVSYFIS